MRKVASISRSGFNSECSDAGTENVCIAGGVTFNSDIPRCVNLVSLRVV